MKPTNELGVIVLFAQICNRVGWESVEVHNHFPDAIIRDLKTGHQYLVEFEYLASNFFDHSHDAEKCDIVICWKNDLKTYPFATVWALSEQTEFHIHDIDLRDKRIASLLIRNRRMERELSDLRPQILQKKKEVGSLRVGLRVNWRQLTHQERRELIGLSPAQISKRYPGLAERTCQLWAQRIREITGDEGGNHQPTET